MDAGFKNAPKWASRVGLHVVAWVVFVLIVLMAWNAYGDYQQAVKAQKTTAVVSSDTTASADASKTAAAVVLVLSENLNMRAKPMANSDIIKKLKKGTKLTLLEKASGWYKVRDADKAEGWVAAGGSYTKLQD